MDEDNKELKRKLNEVEDETYTLQQRTKTLETMIENQQKTKNERQKNNEPHLKRQTHEKQLHL